jgi:hypothetical protein
MCADKVGGTNLRENKVRQAHAYSHWELIMALLLAFVITVLLGDAIAIAISFAVEQFSKQVSLFVFLFLFAGVIPVAWRLAVRFTEPKSSDEAVR